MLIQRIAVRETNCYLLRGEAGTVLVDPGPPSGAAQVIAETQCAGCAAGDIRLIVVTHGHLDHFGAVAAVKAWCGAPVGAYRDEPASSRDPRYALPPAGTIRGSLFRWAYLALHPLLRFPPLEIDIALDEGDSLAPYGVDATIWRVPGHASGSLAVVTAESDAFVGDLIVNYTVPSRPLYIADAAAWQRSYESILALQPRMVYVGHGEPFPGEKLSHIYPARYQLRWWVH